MDAVNSYSCVCEDGFTGTNCSQRKLRMEVIFKTRVEYSYFSYHLSNKHIYAIKITDRLLVRPMSMCSRYTKFKPKNT